MRAQAERMAINAPIQGTEADIIKLAMVDIHAYIEKKKLTGAVKLLLQVHDELVCEVREDLVDTVASDVREIMENVIDPKKTHGVVCVADASVGDNWGEMKKIK
jgi:DNA polymerase-1